MRTLFDTTEEVQRFMNNAIIVISDEKAGIKVQKKLFDLGFIWAWRNNKPLNLQESEYLFLQIEDKKALITYTDNESTVDKFREKHHDSYIYSSDFILSINVIDAGPSDNGCNKHVWMMGSPTYGEQIIEYFKSLGVKNTAGLHGTNGSIVYFIDEERNSIRGLSPDSHDDDHNLICSLVMENWKELSVNDILSKTKNVHTFDKVLVRDDDDEDWFPAFFAEFRDCTDEPYVTTEGSSFKQCIPFDENILESQLNKGTGPCTRYV